MDQTNNTGQQTKCPVPTIIINDRQLRDVTADCLDALYTASPEPIYNRAGCLVVIIFEDGQPSIEIINNSMLIGYLTRCADFIFVSREKEIETFPPPVGVRDILSLKRWNFHKLLALTTIPVIRPNGTILTDSGYDEATRLYFCPEDLNLPVIPENPTVEQINSAIAVVLEPFVDFPFIDDGSHANALAMLLTTILRTLFTGSVPIALFDKNQPGTGASLCTDVICIITSGKAAEMISQPVKEEEWQKLILSILKNGQAICVIDNIENELKGAALSTVLTQSVYTGRILGISQVVTLPCRTVWMATGNNIRLGGDLSRRSIWIRQDAKVAQPWLREMNGFKFKHADLKNWATKNRGKIIAAILLIARAWILAGKPSAKVPVLGGYKSWSKTIGSILAFMGVTGFLNNLQTMYDEVDTEGPQWAAFFQAWHEIIVEKPITVKDLILELDNNAELASCLPISRDAKKDFNRALGSALSQKQDVRYTNGLMLQKAGIKHKVFSWQVVDYTKNVVNPSATASVGETN
jgi:hypothetical protein